MRLKIWGYYGQRPRMLCSPAHIRRRNFTPRYATFCTRHIILTKMQAMQALPFARSGFAPTAVVSLVTLTSLALLGLVLAYWTWVWLAPRAEPGVQAAVQTSGLGAATGLFGSAQGNGNSAAPAGIAVTLLGIVASGSESGYAVLRLDAKETIAVRKGGEIEPGVRLAEVHADRIVLERSGVRETLAWPDPGKSALPAAPRTAK